MSAWEIKVLNGEVSLLRRLDEIIGQHPLDVTVAMICLCLLALLLVIVHAARHHSRAGGRPGPRIIYVESPTPPPRPAPEPPFDPFPPMRDVDYEMERLRDEGYFDD